MSADIESISISELFWVQYKNNRISFRIESLPGDVHFTISWHENSSNINLHITKNTADENNKPKIVIAEIDKKAANELMTFVPACIFNHLYTPISFKNYSRKSRKNIRLCFFDDIEKHPNRAVIEKKATQLFDRASTIKRKKLSLSAGFGNDFIPLLRSVEMRSLLVNNVRNYTIKSFQSTVARAGILFLGDKSLQFISINGKCFTLRQKLTIHSLLTSFMKPELASGMIAKVEEAIILLHDAQTLNDTAIYSNPYQLFIEEIA
jgi:hypothetical protein